MDSDKARELLRKRIVDPLIELLRTGATPRRLAWSLAVGFVIGANPLLGSTTILALAIASIFRLNIVASQIANHLAYPIELVMFPVFMKLGSMLFRTEALPLSRDQIFHAARLHPWATTRLLWTWQWHALVVWAVFAVVASPIIATLLRPVLAKMLFKFGGEHHVANEHVHVLPE